MRDIITISVLFTVLGMLHPSGPCAEEITKLDLLQMENRLKEYIDLRISSVHIRIDEMDKRIGLVQWMIAFLFIIIVVIQGIPQFATFYRERRDTLEFSHRLDQMEQKLSSLAQ